jgi:hypothetical protein
MPIDPKAVIDAKKKVLKPQVAGLKANPNDVAAYKKLKQQKAKEELDAANKGVDEDAEDHSGIDDYYNFTPGKEVEFEYKGKKWYGKIKSPEELRAEKTHRAESILKDWDQLDPRDQKVQFIFGAGNSYYIIDPNDVSFAPMKNLSPAYPKFSFQSNESTNISNFLKAISQKNYAQADKYLQGVVEGKLKASIDKAIQKSTIYAK